MIECARNSQPNPTSDDAFVDCALRYLDGTLSDEEVVRFQGAMASDVAKAESFVDTCLMGKLFAESLRLELQSEGLPAQRIGESAFPDSSSASPPPVLHFLGGTVHGAVGYFSSGWPVAYLTATVIFGIGILVGSLVPVSRPQQLASQSPVDRNLVAQPTVSVGRITGMVDCKWDQGLEIRDKRSENSFHPSSIISHPSSFVSLGDKFTLSSGLIEITYDTGAKVVLQGPVTYEVESAASGFLSLGKLTARLESRSRLPSGTRSAESRPAGGTYLFAVRTPTATVTDLGTEFGVEVRQSGATSAHVFRGVVEVHPAAKGGEQPGQAVRLTENESVQVEGSGAGGGLTVRREKIDSAVFVRAEQLPKLAAEQRFGAFRRWQAYSQQLRRDPSLLAYYDFQHKPGFPAVLANVAAHGDRALDGVVENATWSTGRMLGKHALLFNGPGDYVSINLPQKTDNLTLAAWLCFDSLANQTVGSGLVMSTGWLKPGQVAWQVDNKDGHVGFACASSDRNTCNSPPVIGSDRLRRWIHLACVYDHAAASVRFYVDGRSVSVAEYRTTAPIVIGPAWIGNWNPDGLVSYPGSRNFRGRMDELAIFGRALSADEVQRMYEAGSFPSRATLGELPLQPSSSGKGRKESAL